MTVITDTSVKYADLFAKGIDLAESIDLGIKHDILNGIITPSKMEIYELSKLQGDDLIQAVRNLRIPKEQRMNQLQEIAATIEKEFENRAEQKREQEANPVLSSESSLTAITTEFEPKEASANMEKSEEREIEECKKLSSIESFDIVRAARTVGEDGGRKKALKLVLDLYNTGNTKDPLPVKF